MIRGFRQLGAGFRLRASVDPRSGLGLCISRQRLARRMHNAAKRNRHEETRFIGRLFDQFFFFLFFFRFGFFVFLRLAVFQFTGLCRTVE